MSVKRVIIQIVDDEGKVSRETLPLSQSDLFNLVLAVQTGKREQGIKESFGIDQFFDVIKEVNNKMASEGQLKLTVEG